MNKQWFFFLGCMVSAPSLAEDVERVTVTAKRPYYHQTLQQIFPQTEYNQDELVSPGHLNDLLLQSPLISLNGQGGQLQSVSIRGFSRWRIQTLLDDVPVFSDRRAGSSFDFIPPSFIGNALVVPGAASTYLGSGAIGGAVNLRFAETTGQQLQLGWGSNQHYQHIGYAGQTTSMDWKLSYRKADNGSDAEGNTLFDQFEQNDLFLRHRPEQSAIQEVWTLYSENNNIGKSSSDFPESRITLYPTNDHWLGKLRFQFGAIQGGAWWHQSRLETDINRPEKRINQSRNDALDYGIDFGSKADIQLWQMNWRVQLSGRDGVMITERELTPEQQLVYENQPLDAREHNAAGVIDAARSFGDTSVALGARLNWQQQHNSGISVSNTNLSGFAGLSHQLSPAWATSLYLSTGFRDPTLTERFFLGETPRGRVLGDVNLETEQALNIQGTVHYNSRNLQASAEAFFQQIDEYIEREEVTENLLQYVNLDQAEISGISYQLNWQPSAWGVNASGAWIRGEDQDGLPIADIPAHKQRLELSYQSDQWRAFTTMQYRADKTRIADGERALDSVVSWDIGLSWQLSEQLVLKARWQNLSDQQYYTSADDKAAFAHGQDVQVSLDLTL